MFRTPGSEALSAPCTEENGGIKTGIKWKNKLIQYLEDLLTPAPGSQTFVVNAASCFAPYIIGCGRNLTRRGAISSSLLEHRSAGFAEAGLLPPQAGGNGPHIRDLAWTKTTDVGGAGFFLLRRCLRS
jgi:hypothetical protein